MNVSEVKPGARVRVTQLIEQRDETWETHVEGILLSAEPKPTGSWYAHGKDDRYWLLRIELQKDDGEITRMTLDRNTRITILDS